MIALNTFVALYMAAAVAAGVSPVIARRDGVESLDQAAFGEAQQRDDTATREFANVQIKTSDGKCLFVDELSGDFRANLTPVQVAQCGSTDGQGWDVITSGKHNDQEGQILIVSTLTQACFNFDPRRPAGNQVLLFSCGGRADGGGEVTDSQLFGFPSGGSGPLALEPKNASGQCLVAKDDVVDIETCDKGEGSQMFTFGDDAGGSSDGGGSSGDETSEDAAADGDDDDGDEEEDEEEVLECSTESTAATSAGASVASTALAKPKSSCAARVVTVTKMITVTASDLQTGGNVINAPPAPSTATTTTKQTGSSPTAGATTTAAPPSGGGGIPTINPTIPVPVSRAGGTLDPSAAAEANGFDDTAERAVESVNIRAADGRCLFVDPTAGDFRQNLIPVQLANCTEAPNQKFDIVTGGKHNDDSGGKALLVSVLMDGCLSFDGRREEGDTVTIFSCGGRADGGGETDSAQLYPFDEGSNKMILQPASGNGDICLVPGEERLESCKCRKGKKEEVFEIVEVL